MKLVSWNVNGIRAVTGQNPSRRFDVVTQENKFFDFVYKENPDLICIQETKASQDQIKPELISPEGYYYYYNDCKVKKGYSGTALFTKIKPISVNYGIGIPKFDDEGRILISEFDQFIHFGVYFPKGYADHERLTFKLDFYDALTDYIKNLLDKGKSVVVAGDYNTAHHEIDLARPDENIGTSGFMPIEREKLDKLNEIGMIDSYRQFVKDNGNYTWWSNRARARERNVGWRLDYHFISNSLLKYLKSADQFPDVHGSDHCPVMVEFDFGN